jgi:hypothetical protein
VRRPARATVRDKERDRQERERLHEERKVQREIQRERDRLDKEKQHYVNALAALEAKGDVEAATRMRAQLDDIARAIEDVDHRAANVKAGYVYVISNPRIVRRTDDQGENDQET